MTSRECDIIDRYICVYACVYAYMYMCICMFNNLLETQAKIFLNDMIRCHIKIT